MWGSIVITWGGPRRGGQGGTQKWGLRGAPGKKGELTEGWGPGEMLRFLPLPRAVPTCASPAQSDPETWENWPDLPGMAVRTFHSAQTQDLETQGPMVWTYRTNEGHGLCPEEL